jgi:ABC-type lipoprotein release transport system permease subunit
MVLTFLNIVVVSGILVGLIEGSITAQRDGYSGDVFLSTLDEKNYIENSSYIESLLQNFPEVVAISPRYADTGKIESNYKSKIRATDDGESAGAVIIGIDPDREGSVTTLRDKLVEGQFIQENDFDQIVVGANLLKKYLNFEGPGLSTIDAETGDTVLISIGDNVRREVVIKGVIKTKVGENDSTVFFPAKQLRQMIGRDDFNVDQFAIKLAPKTDPIPIKERLINLGVDKYADVQTYEDAQPKFLEDIKNTFAMLGNAISSIGLVVASITVFIVIFINAITRRKFIGILKGIGIDQFAIESSYMIQSFFYAIIGSIIGFAIVYGFLVPFVAANPINFPFSDGILVAPLGGTFIKMGILVAITVVAGYIPARMIVRKNTLDSILGR